MLQMARPFLSVMDLYRIRRARNCPYRICRIRIQIVKSFEIQIEASTFVKLKTDMVSCGSLPSNTIVTVLFGVL